MPFGLRNSSGTFQRFFNNQLSGVQCTMAYLDDVLIFSRTVEDHKKDVHSVLSKLDAVGLKVNEAKCKFFQDEIEFLGYNITKNGIQPPQSRVEALSQLPEPKEKKETQRILGMFGFYQRCIPSYASLALPLRMATRSENFEWTQLQSDAFSQLKESLKSAVQLSFPDRNGMLSITADASNVAIEACLNQSVGDEVKSLSFFSRKLTEHEKTP